MPLTVIPHQHVGCVAIANPMPETAVAQLHRLRHGPGLLRRPFIDLVGWRQQPLELRGRQTRRDLAEESVSDVQQ